MSESFWNICLLHGIQSRDQLLREAIRVVRIKQILGQDEYANNASLEDDPEKLFQFIKEYGGERELGHFPDDWDLFYQLYQAGQDLDLLEYAVQTIQHDRVIGGVMAPAGIMEHCLDLCSRHHYDSVLIAETEKYLRGLVETQCFKTSLDITLLTENYIMGRLLKTYFGPFRNVTVIQGSIYQPLPLEKQYDAILSLPNFGMKVNDVDTVTIRESEAVAINNLLPLLASRGTITAVLPARIMFQSGDIATWRKHVNAVAPVKSIYALPEGFFRPFTSVKTYQVEFTPNPVKEVVLGRLTLQKRKLVADREIPIHSDQFRLLEDWRIDVLLDEDLDMLRAFQHAALPKVKLRDVAEIFRGKSILKPDLKPGRIHVLNISNLNHGEVQRDELETIDEDERKVQRYEILPGDLVMTCRGTVSKLAVFPESEDHAMVIASANILVIRFKSRVLSHFAKIFLESPTGTALIHSFQRGTTVMNLNPADVAELEVPLLPEEKQRAMVHRYLREQDRYHAIIRQATVHWEQVKNQVYAELY